MSDINDPQGAQNSQAPSPQAQQQSIPKERFDEVIAEKRALLEQTQMLQHLLRQAVPQQAPTPQALPPHLEKLKEEQPHVFEQVMAQEHQLKQTRAALFDVKDGQDRLQFLAQYGQLVPSDKMNAVEAKLDELRSQGIHHWNRGQILLHMTGQEALVKKPTAQTPVSATPAPQANNGDVPSSDASAAATTATGSAPAGSANETLEQMEARLANTVL